MSTTSTKVFETLLRHYGPQHWWPGETPLEVMIGAVLVQNTSWKNVERAITSLRENEAIDAQRLLDLEVSELADLIRSAGYYRRKAVRLQSLLKFFVDRYQGSIELMRQIDVPTLRQQLLGVHGVGPETADAILLYALEKPVLVVDAYTQRIYARHGWVDCGADYHRLQQHLVGELPLDAKVYNELHALLVAVGKEYCRARAPRCESCPLRELLPSTGVVEISF